MTDFMLHPRLLDDCFVLGEMECSLVLLMNNALVPWFILVPRTGATEICDMEESQRALLFEEINMLSRLVKDNFPVDKLNVAAIGNVVEQLHVHVVGRSRNDYCWPHVVWGAQGRELYDEQEVRRIVSVLQAELGGGFAGFD